MTEAIKLASKLIQFPSITPSDSDEKVRLEHYKACEDTLNFLKGELGTINGIKLIEKLVFSGDHEKWSYPVTNLYVEIEVGNPKAKNYKSLCYMGHIDVVPLGNELLWNVGPFSGELKDGFVYGRGATDMKGSVASWVIAIKSLINNLPSDFNGKIGTLITGDEEWAAVNGRNKVLAWLKNKGKKFDGFIVGEPSSPDQLGTHIKIGRRGSLVGYIDSKGVQGHRAYDSLFINPNRALTTILAVLNTLKWKDETEYFPATTFETVAIQSGDFGASAIIPGNARSMWNVRFTGKQTKEAIVEKIEKKIKKSPKFFLDDCEYEKLTKDITVSANFNTASIPYYSDPSTLAESAKMVIKDVLGIEATYDGFGGTTDGRFIHEHFPQSQIIELGVPEKGGIIESIRSDDYEKKGGMHQIDERVSQKDLENLTHIYKGILTRF